MRSDDHSTLRLACLIALATMAVALSACGGSDKPAAPPGSPQNPLVAKQTPGASGGRSNEAGATASAAPGYQKLLERQSGKPRRRFTPCNLVTRTQARAILGTSVRAPLEAPQGPTCIYRSESGRTFITLAVQTLDFGRVRKQLNGRRAVDVSGRTAYCGVYGQPMLYVSLSGRRVLSVAGSCPVAQRFATRALARLR